MSKNETQEISKNVINKRLLSGVLPYPSFFLIFHLLVM